MHDGKGPVADLSRSLLSLLQSATQQLSLKEVRSRLTDDGDSLA